jgi:hypothetical protein
MLRVMAGFGLSLLSAMLGCGGASDLPSTSAVSVSLAPSTATIQVGQTIDLTGTATGFTNPTISWWEQDQHDAAVNGDGEEDCDDITAVSSNLIATCAYGYLTNSAMAAARTGTATYHAPPTPGTYHVTFRAFQVSTIQWGDSVERRAKATITVTP